MNLEQIKIKNEELLKSFQRREKINVSPNHLKDSYFMTSIKAWALDTGMGSDAHIIFVKNNGEMLHYDHHKYSSDNNTFYEIVQNLLSQDEEWGLYKCNFLNEVYVRPEDKKWFDKCFNSIIRPRGCPLVAIECICQNVVRKKAVVNHLYENFRFRGQNSGTELLLCDAKQISMTEILAWAHYVGHYDSCNTFLFVTKEGKVLHCDFDREKEWEEFSNGYRNYLLAKDEQKWNEKYCAMGNILYYRDEDKDCIRIINEQFARISRHPFFLLECIYRKHFKK